MTLNSGLLLISACLLLVAPGRLAYSSKSCTSLTDLAEPCGCTLTKENFDPICGTDGNTYMNPCFMDCQKTLQDTDIKVEHKGACSKNTNCVCTSTYEPVCGSNGVTYPNDCVLKCNVKKLPSLQLKYKGVCDDMDDLDETRLLRVQSETRCVCNPTDGPVCASNGITYTNYCVLRCRALKKPSIKFVNWGACKGFHDTKLSEREELKVTPPAKKTCGCGATTYYTRCGNGGRYKNPCEQRCENLNKPVKPPRSPCDSIVEKVIPRPEDEKLSTTNDNTCYCSSMNRPVCGSNGLTYTNNCVLHCTTKKDPSITFQRWGPCGMQHHSDEAIRLVSRGKNALRKGTLERGSLRFELESFGRRRF